MADDEQRRGNVVAKETKGETSTTVQSKARKARRKTLDTRAAAGMSVKPPPHILKEAMRKHFLFAATSSVVESEIDAVIAVMTPRRLADGEFLFGGDDAMAPDEGSSGRPRSVLLCVHRFGAGIRPLSRSRLSGEQQYDERTFGRVP